MPNNSFTDFIHNPHDQATVTAETVEGFQTGEVGRFDLRNVIPAFASNDITTWGSQLIIIQAYTGHGKSIIADIILKYMAEQCQKNECVVKVSYENTLQEDGVKRVAAQLGVPANNVLEGKLNDMQLAEVNTVAMQIAKTPLWWVGPDENTSRHFRLPKISELMVMLRRLVEEQHIYPRMIVIDHFHEIPIERHTNSDVSSLGGNVKMLTALSFAFPNCPLVVLAQSNRDSQKEKKFKLPYLDGLKGTSDLESAARFVLSLWIPARSEGYKAGIDDIKIGKDYYLVTDDLMVMGVMKQKYAAYPVLAATKIDWENYEVKTPYPMVDIENSGINHD